MKAFKGAKADVTEKIQNVYDKVDEMSSLNKASAAAKAERMEADNKAAKHDAKANYHNKQAAILREYEQKKASNAAHKEQTKTALHQKKADKHVDKADKHANATSAVVADGNADDDVERATTAPAADSVDSRATAPANPTFHEGKPSIPVPSEGGEPASNARQEEGTTDTNTSRDAAGAGIPGREAAEEDMNATYPNDALGSDPVHHNEVPLHGSGVPTHSTLHSRNPGTDTHDARTTETMAGSPNNGSYM